MTDDEKAIAEYKRFLSETLRRTLAKPPREGFVEQGCLALLEELRKRPWERDERGLVWRYEFDGCQFEDRWDGESLTIDRVVTLPTRAERITVNFTVEDKP